MHRYWNDGWSGNWWWMGIMMIALAAGLIWIAVTLIRHPSPMPHPQAPGAAPTVPARQSPQDFLADRLARGEIEPDDYRQCLDTLEHRPNAKP